MCIRDRCEIILTTCFNEKSILRNSPCWISPQVGLIRVRLCLEWRSSYKSDSNTSNSSRDMDLSFFLPPPSGIWKWGISTLGNAKNGHFNLRAKFRLDVWSRSVYTLLFNENSTQQLQPYWMSPEVVMRVNDGIEWRATHIRQVLWKYLSTGLSWYCGSATSTSCRV